MRYPDLIPRSICKIPITITIHKEGLTEDGAPVKAFKTKLLCNYQSRVSTIHESEKKQVQLSGVALLPGDICPDLPELSGGKAKLFGTERLISGSIKARNPDGTVNYTRLELM